MSEFIRVVDEPTIIAYYCKQCKKVVSGQSKGGKKKYTFTCPECKEECFYGTARSLIHALRIKENSDDGQALLKLREEKLLSLHS